MLQLLLQPTRRIADKWANQTCMFFVPMLVGQFGYANPDWENLCIFSIFSGQHNWAVNRLASISLTLWGSQANMNILPGFVRLWVITVHPATFPAWCRGASGRFAHRSLSFSLFRDERLVWGGYLRCTQTRTQQTQGEPQLLLINHHQAVALTIPMYLRGGIPAGAPIGPHGNLMGAHRPYV